MFSGLPLNGVRQARIGSQPAVSGTAKLAVEQSTADERRIDDRAVDATHFDACCISAVLKL